MRKEIHGPELITNPRSTTIPIRRALRKKSNPWDQIEAAADLALGYRYACCGSVRQDISFEK